MKKFMIALLIGLTAITLPQAPVIGQSSSRIALPSWVQIGSRLKWDYAIRRMDPDTHRSTLYIPLTYLSEGLHMLNIVSQLKGNVWSLTLPDYFNTEPHRIRTGYAPIEAVVNGYEIDTFSKLEHTDPATHTVTAYVPFDQIQPFLADIDVSAVWQGPYLSLRHAILSVPPLQSGVKFSISPQEYKLWEHTITPASNLVHAGNIVAAINNSSSPELNAYDLTSGQPLWSTSFMEELYPNFYTGVLASTDNTILYTSDILVDGLYIGYTTVNAVSAFNGKPLWKHSLEQPIDFLEANNQDTFVASRNELYVLNNKTGTIGWHTSFKSAITALSVNPAGVAIGTSSGQVTLYNNQGKFIRQLKSSQTAISSIVPLADGAWLAGAGNSLMAVTHIGKVSWSHRFPFSIMAGNVAVGDGSLFVISSAGYAAKMNATNGKILLQRTLNFHPMSSLVPVYNDGKLYVTTQSYAEEFLNANTLTTEGMFNLAPYTPVASPIATDGVVVITSNIQPESGAGHLTAIR